MKELIKKYEDKVKSLNNKIENEKDEIKSELFHNDFSNIAKRGNRLEQYKKEIQNLETIIMDIKIHSL